ncbi:hypothetical protein ACHQM5_004217 [Ranunculus cassubicifolius]
MARVHLPPCEKPALKKGVWSPEEDAILTSFINENGHGNWRALPQRAGLNRCGKSCRLRWLNYLRPGLKRGNFTRDEEETIIRLHNSIGNKWSQIAAKLPGRTDNEIKNVWNKYLKAHAESMRAEQSWYWYSYSYSYSYSYWSLSSFSNSSNSNWNGESEEEEEEKEEGDSLYEGLLKLPSQRDLNLSDIFEDNKDYVSSPKGIQDTSSNMQETSSSEEMVEKDNDPIEMYLQSDRLHHPTFS